jgi:uncharacterized protein YjbI with pentapeptide repeats
MAAARVDNYMDPLNRDAAATAVPDGDDAPAARHALTTEDADRIRAELLALMAPFPPSRESLWQNTTAALQLLEGLPDEEVAKVTNSGGFIAKITAVLDRSEPAARSQPVARTYSAGGSDKPYGQAQEALPDASTVTWEDVDNIIRDSGYAFNCAETVWQQWLRLPYVDHDPPMMIPYEYEDPFSGESIGVSPGGHKLEMSPQVALVSTLLRAMDKHCPTNMQFSYLWNANLAGAELSVNETVVDKPGGKHPVDFSGSWLAGIVLVGAQLHCSNMQGANLSGASLQKCDLSFCNLADNNQDNADHRGANYGACKLKNCLLYGKWDLPPPLPRPLTRSRKPLGICRMIVRAALASGDSDDDDSSDESDGDDDEEEEADDPRARLNGDGDHAIWEVKDTPKSLLVDYLNAVDVIGDTSGAALLPRLANRKQWTMLLAKLQTDIAQLALHKKAIEKTARKVATQQTTAMAVRMLDVKSLRSQYKTVTKTAVAQDGNTEKELDTLLRLHKEISTTAARIDAQLEKSDDDKKTSKDFEQWVGSELLSYKGWLRSPHAPLADIRIGVLLAASLHADSSSAYNFGMLSDFAAMMSTDARQLAADRKELEILAVELEELLVPVTPLNYQDVLNSWLTLMKLCGKFSGTRAQAILHQLFDDKTLLSAIGMAKQLDGVDPGENGNAIPNSLIGQFKEGTTARLRDDKFTYVQAINKEIANIERVAKRQAQFVSNCN